MLRIASLVAILTVISKILGLIRDLVIANYFGTSVVSDAFNMAYLFTGNFFVIFGCIGGPFYSSLIAILPKVSEARFSKFISNLLRNTFWVSSLLTVVIYFTKSQLLKIFIDPEQKPEYFQLTLFHIDFLLPLITICGPIGIIAALLNFYKKYFEPSLAPAVVNLAAIFAIFMMGDAFNGLAMSLGFSIGGVLSLLFQLPSLRQIFNQQYQGPHAEHPQRSCSSNGALTEMVPDEEHQAKLVSSEYKNILFPALLATGISQATVFVDSFFCSGLEEGSWTALVLSNRLIQMPLGVLVTSFLVPVFPRLSELANKNDIAGVKRQVKKLLFALTILCLPAVAIGMIWTEPIIRLIFERGEFDAHSTALVSTVFFYQCLTVLPYIFRDTITRIFYSFGDSNTPMYVSVLGIVLKVIFNYLLIDRYGLAGIAMASVYVVLLTLIVMGVLLWLKAKSRKIA